MGALTLKQFRSLVLANPLLQGQGDIDNDLIDAWINLGYAEVTGAVEFEELTHCASLNTVDGVSEYNMPVNFAGIISIQDRTSGAKLARISLRDMHRKTFDERGYPTYYARKERGIIIWPVPDGIYSFHAYFVRDMTPLAEAGDRTVLPATWDKAVLLFAQENALRNYNMFDAADKAFMRSIQMMRSRLTSADLDEPQEGMLRVVRSWADVMLNAPSNNRL